MRPRLVTAVAAAVLVLTAGGILSSRDRVRPKDGNHLRSSTSSLENIQGSTPAPRNQGPAWHPDSNAGRSSESAVGSAVTERIDPREPLSKIGQALPPKPKMPEDWKGTTLFNPVATAAGLIEVKGYKLAVAGLSVVVPEERCDFETRSWPCGLRARAAFRSWLRGRAITCTVPPDPERDTIVAECTLDRQDIGAWLVGNGWARPAGEEYAGLGETAMKTGRGIYGRPASTSAPAAFSAESELQAPSEGDAILAPTPSDQEEVFPPAPAPPSGSIVTLPALPKAPAQ